MILYYIILYIVTYIICISIVAVSVAARIKQTLSVGPFRSFSLTGDPSRCLTPSRREAAGRAPEAAAATLAAVVAAPARKRCMAAVATPG